MRLVAICLLLCVLLPRTTVWKTLRSYTMLPTTDREECNALAYPKTLEKAALSNSLTVPAQDKPTLKATTPPWPGQSFIICDPKTNLVIALNNGNLGLSSQRTKGYSEGIHWYCVENNEMWLGFYNSISGAYIGHNNRNQFIATARWHDAWEYFCAREHPDGGYLLLVKHWGGFLPMKVGEKNDLVVDVGRNGGTAWEFIRV